MTKRIPAYVPLLVFLIVAAFSLAAYGTKRNQDQVDYLCKVAGTLTSVLDSQASQIQANFDNGFYAKLEKSGVLTPENIAASHQTLDQFHQATELLKDPDSPCKGISSKAGS